MRICGDAVGENNDISVLPIYPILTKLGNKFSQRLGHTTVKWRIGLLIHCLLEHWSGESDEVFSGIESSLGSQYKKGTLRECLTVYEAFPSHGSYRDPSLGSIFSRDGKDVPTWALHEQKEYTKFWKVYVFLAREKAIRTETDRLLWARMKGLSEVEVKETIKYAKGKGMLGTPGTAFEAWRAEVEVERRKRSEAVEAEAKKNSALLSKPRVRPVL